MEALRFLQEYQVGMGQSLCMVDKSAEFFVCLLTFLARITVSPALAPIEEIPLVGSMESFKHDIPEHGSYYHTDHHI